MKIVLTHSRGRLAGLEEALAAAGHEAAHVPLVSPEPLRDEVTVEAVRELNACPWLLLTSANAARYWIELGGSLAPSEGIGVVGPGTAATVHGQGGRVDFVAPAGTGESLAAEFLHRRLAGPVALPIGERASSDTQRVLAWAGIEVRTLVVYRTVSLPWPCELTNVDALLVASPSALDAVPTALARAAGIVAIGPTTAAAVRARGLDCLQAEAPTPEAVLRAFTDLAGRRLGRTEGVNA